MPVGGYFQASSTPAEYLAARFSKGLVAVSIGAVPALFATTVTASENSVLCAPPVTGSLTISQSAPR